MKSEGDNFGPLGCENIILFLTDGLLTEGADFEDLYKIINYFYLF